MAPLISILSTVFLYSSAFASTLQQSRPHKRAACEHHQETINGRLYTVSCGVDRPGGNYNQTQTADLEGCVQVCASDTQCVTAQYVESTSFCYLKDQLNYERLDSGVDSVTLGTGCQPHEVDFTCNIECGTDRPGGDYNLAQLGSFQACIAACEYDNECLTAQYDETIGFCYFKNVTNAAVPKPNIDSVVCRKPN